MFGKILYIAINSTLLSGNIGNVSSRWVEKNVNDLQIRKILLFEISKLTTEYQK